MKKFNEFNSFDEREMDGEIESPKEDMSELEKLESGEVNKVEINGFHVSKPSELDGEFLIDKDGKHMRKSNIQEVVDVVTGKAVFESRRHRRHK